MQDRDDASPNFSDIPSADPQIKESYEAALGAFLVSFNRIEYVVNEIVFLALQKSERQDILEHMRSDSFYRKLITLDLISLAYSRPLPKSLVDELRELSIQRNKLAHGHFDQNPFDGSYTIAPNKIDTNRSKPAPMPINQLILLTRRADKAWDDLRYAHAFFCFDDLDAEEVS